MKLQSFKVDANGAIPANVQNISPWFSLHIFANFTEKEPATKFYGAFDYFWQTHEVTKFWLIKLCLDVSDVIHTNEYTY